MEINIFIVLTWFLVGAVFASPLVKHNRTGGLGEKLKDSDFPRLEPVDHYRDDPRYPLESSPFSAPATRNSSFVARRIIQKRPDTEENEPKLNQTRQSGNKTEHEYKPPKPDSHIYVSLDKMEVSEHEKTLAKALLKNFNKTLGETEIENPTDEDKEHEEYDNESEGDSDSDSDDGEDAKKRIKRVYRMIQKRDEEKGEEEKKPYLWPEHNRPKVSKDGKFRYLYSSEGKQYAVATPQHLANEVSEDIQLYSNHVYIRVRCSSLQTNRHEKAQQEREQKLDIIQHELQKEMDAKLQK
ncbi:uncharacterized protein FPRO_00731 [Fusarium proliferatum ET1]|uniref:Uncharacterized protein n=1 Tax=Fusarium proliferatum (strain ET1) TaxID=1227346 RepID=A0A1L7V2M3_FUSPR|nr:uncharacterized protein FPRO_00731 [Fusarium proliferatum ET1]CZR35147.1 uncharacterized protein FPRO_00731 [Fusarium proliferatum ET1]